MVKKAGNMLKKRESLKKKMENHTLINRLEYEDQFREKLINHILIMWTGLAIIGVLFVCVRALEIGWTTRDLVQIIVVTASILLTIYRKKMSTGYKAAWLLAINLIVGGSGILTIGMFAGGVFLFPLVIVILALFYSSRSVALCGVLLVLFFCITAICFTSGLIELKSTASQLMTSYSNWSIYTLCIVFFILITCVTILNYRRAIQQLVNELEEKNIKIQNALDEIKTLRGILPLCSFCKKIRNDKGYWEQVDVYIQNYSDADISHSICPHCLEEHYPEFYDGG